MKKTILIAGGSGLIGSRLVEYLDTEKYDVRILSRAKRPPKKNVHYFQWNTSAKTIEEGALDGVDVLINLAGAGVADKRWTQKRKEVLLNSRVDSLRTLKEVLGQHKVKPKLFIGASAIGYYGNRGAETLTTESTSGDTFLSEITKQWEEASLPLMDMIERSVLLRIGIVLSTRGGALAEMLKPSSFGVYGYFGRGDAYYAWVHIDDICKMIVTAIEEDAYAGIYNATAVHPITIKALAKELKRTKKGFGLVLPVPEFALRLGLGEMADMLTASTGAIPQRLLREGFQFNHPDLSEAISDLLDRRI